ncbi:SNF2-related protein [Streptococcus suis]|nr:SNF2-related protein [Streptococcus suis]
MARKFDLISELYERTCFAVTDNPVNWQSFLKTAGRNFRLRFDEQLLIYAQRPDATAVLEIERWNGTFGRWVNRGAKGIAVFEDADRSRQRLIHYFDISDTHESRYSRPVPIWEMRPEYEAEVIETLENTFGAVNDTTSIENVVKESIANAVEDNIADYISDFMSLGAGSDIEYLSADEANALYLELIRNSVSYMVMARLGLDADKVYSPDDFAGISNFNSQEVLNAVGIATSDIAEMALLPVSRTISSLSKENRIIDEQGQSEYNKDIKDERSQSDERNHIHDGGRLQSSEPEAAGADGSDSRQMVADEENLSEGTSQNPVLQSSDERDSEQSLGGGSAESERTGGNSREADGRESGTDRADESRRYDEMGSIDEQHQELGTGNREESGNIRLEYYDRNHEDKSLPFFGGDDTIREILGTTPHLSASKEEIKDFYKRNTDNATRTEYIKGIFNNDYTQLTLSDGRLVGYKTFQNVLHLWEGEYENRTAQSFYDWGVIAQHFEAMRLLGELTDTMKPLPSMDGQLTLIMGNQAEEQKTSAFTFSQEIIDAVLTRGSGVSEGKMRIYEQFEKSLSAKENADFLKNEYGWGGIPEAFDERAGAWHTEYAMLKNILTPEEYASARESTLTAFYTPPEVSTAIYKVLEQMGFQEGNLLEPSCGIGNFIGMLPKSMENAKVYGVELDTISAGIAQQLYQKASIAAQGFEEVNVPDSFFDGVIGNVPFGDFKVSDKRYDKYNFLIHDYFFAKSLDKLRPGGVMALVTSKGTMDKENSNVRKYIAQRAELLGAIRLPNDTFKGNAGTEVVSDILFLQKRDRLIDIEPDWVHLDTDENGIRLNSYFVQHPEMILGEMKMVSGRFGPEATCEPFENADLSELLNEAVSNIHGEISEYEVADELEEEDNSIPAGPTVRNFSYTVLDDKIYFRENSRMSPVEVSATAENRIKGMIGIRDCVRNLIELQTEDYPDSEIKQAQEKLNTLYDGFTKKYGLINSRANTSAFSDDSSYALLSALEVINEDGELERKADMFFKRTIKPHKPVTEVDTADEALAVSMGEKAAIDMEYMMELSGKSEEELFADLKGVIFLNPLYEYGNSYEPKYLMADEYLSGNVREKLATAKRSATLYPEDYTVNVQALEKVQPKDLTASEISVRLGATWIPPEIFQQFMFEFLDTPRYAQWNIKVHYSQFTGEWNIEGKSYDRSNVKAYSTYGTSRINAYKIIEETLNLKDVRIFDYIEDDEGKKKAVLNKKETAIAQAKQELIKQGFQDWIWADPARREKLTKMYNEKFNSIRPREYDGSHIVFNGMNPEIELREHQKNAVAHILYGGNTLLAHAVGAGKTFEMVAAAMESKRLGLCNKSLFVVPNHLTEQWAAEFLQLYPAANILVATKRDFETKNRKKFCGRIATGDYDAVIIGHSQFEKIPMSIERQRAILEQQLEELTDGIMDLKRNRGENFSIKQLEKSKKSVKQKLEKLNDQSRKDDVVTFEELGVDRLFIDESHYYKNLYLYTKMRNVGGIAQTEAQKSSDLFMKCRYLDELTGGRGTVFATGTPISNSMVELYTIQRYLQYNTLVKNNLQHFDSWASTFGETVTAVELTPEGTGYRAKTRFAKFYNLPELMAMFKEVADIKTADMLELPVPEAHFHNVAVKPSEMQKEMVASLAERAEKVRGGGVDSSVDNMLKIVRC